MRIALENCLLIDGTGRAPEPGMTVVLDGAEIVEVGDRREHEPGTRVVDARRADCHARAHRLPHPLRPLGVRPRRAPGRAALVPLGEDPAGARGRSAGGLHRSARPGWAGHRVSRRGRRRSLPRPADQDERHDDLSDERDRRHDRTTGPPAPLPARHAFPRVRRPRRGAGRRCARSCVRAPTSSRSPSREA